MSLSPAGRVASVRQETRKPCYNMGAEGLANALASYTLPHASTAWHAPNHFPSQSGFDKSALDAGSLGQVLMFGIMVFPLL